MKAFLVCGPFAREEDEAVEHHAGAQDGNVFDRFFENDVEVTVHLRGVCYPPQVDPVGVDLRCQLRKYDGCKRTYLVVGDEDHALRKVTF